jgi:DHA3 family tetracycline resistance protein-like MFS transporter
MRRLAGAGPVGAYYVYAASFSFFFWMTSALNLVYMAVVVGLSPLQMVVVGSVLEASVFLFEIPTGLVADLVSRRLSVLIGMALIGVGFVLQGLGTTFAAMLAAQVVWGVGYTFTSGADTAWLTDELDADLPDADRPDADLPDADRPDDERPAGLGRLGDVLVRAQQLRLAAQLAGTLAAGGLGLIELRLPLVVSGAGFIAAAGVLAVLMRERHFRPAPAEQRGGARRMAAALAGGLAAARRSRVVRALLVVSLLTGLSSEAVDRLWTVRIVDDFAIPGWLGSHGTALLFAAISLIGSAISLAASLTYSRIAGGRGDGPRPVARPHSLLSVLIALEVLGIVGLAVVGSLWIALASLWARNAAVAVAAPVQSAWLNRNLDSATRATALSLVGQSDAIGQVAGGPPLGALADRAGVPIALLVSAGILAPAAAVYRLADRRLPSNPRRQPLA